jgi:hypothetical protein
MYKKCKNTIATDRDTYCREDQIFNDSYYDTFHDYVERELTNRYHAPTSFYLSHLQDALTFIPRSQLFILNFEQLIHQATQIDSINRLLMFLSLPILLPTTKPIFPHVNSKESHCGSRGDHCDEASETDTILCSDVKLLNETFTLANQGLIDFINSDPNRPESEPEFRTFIETLDVSCVATVA